MLIATCRVGNGFTIARLTGVGKRKIRIATGTKILATNSRKLRFFQSKPPDQLIAARDAGGKKNGRSEPPPPFIQKKYQIQLSEDEQELFNLLRQVTTEIPLSSTLRVAGGWVRDKLLATPEFSKYHSSNPDGKRLTSKFRSAPPSMGRQGTKVIGEEGMNQPVDIDIALDDMLGREFADHLNEYLSQQGKETASVGVVLKNPEKSKHLETATMKVGTFWIDFVNLRAEEYTQDSRIPDMMRIGTASEDAFRRDLTINALFFNINTEYIEDFTGRGFQDLQRGLISTPLAPLTTLLDDPLRVLRSVRFAARLRFTMDEKLKKAAMDPRVREALALKVSRERVGGEVDLMLRSPDPVGAMRLLINLNLVLTVFPIEKLLGEGYSGAMSLLSDGLNILSSTHDHLCECKANPPLWCTEKGSMTTHGYHEIMLLDDGESRRLLWYAAYLKPLMDFATKAEKAETKPQKGKKANRSIVIKLLVDELKRPARDAEAVEKIIRAADDFANLIEAGSDLHATSVLLSGISVSELEDGNLRCTMNGREICSETEQDPLWESAMEFRLLASNILDRVGILWRAALILSLSEQLVDANGHFIAIQGDVIDESQEELRRGLVDKYDIVAAAFQKLGLIGIWTRKPLIDGDEVKKVLPNIPRGPVFREVMNTQKGWITTHPNGGKEGLTEHLRAIYPDFT